MSAPLEPEYLTIREAAVLLRCCPDTVRAGIRRGELHAVRIGRVVRLPRASLAGVVVDSAALEVAAA